jgi:2-methylisocitrate lyase-like PEP mutase family enzyme
MKRMSDHAETARRFMELHSSETPLLLPNPWDVGAAKLLAWLGFKALATTSGGFAASLGRLDGNVSREEALAPVESASGSVSSVSAFSRSALSLGRATGRDYLSQAASG